MTPPAGTPAAFSAEVSAGEWKRQVNRFTGRFCADGSTGWPVEPGRYVLYVSLACPWAHRAVIVREVLGLQDALGLVVVDPLRDEKGWRFTLDRDGRDPVTGSRYLSELYHRSDPDYSGRVTVPTIWDTRTGQVVTNDYPQITLDLHTAWRGLHAAGAPDLYPEHLRAEIDEMAEANYHAVNNGVYKAGFATSQEAYGSAYDALFARLDELSAHLAEHRYLVGDQLTEADVRLFTTLVRFDAAYHGHFKCNRSTLVEMPVLWAYARDLYSRPGFGSTVDLDHIKGHYYGTHPTINPTLIVPRGPERDWTAPHGRDALG